MQVRRNLLLGFILVVGCNDFDSEEPSPCEPPCAPGLLCEVSTSGTESAQCVVSICGNKTLEGDETCDDGALNSDTRADACRLDCKAARCGDSVTDSGEECDNGAFNSDLEADACRTNCVQPSCGDGVQDANESCDDGNDNNTDACLNSCSCGSGYAAGDSGCTPVLCDQNQRVANNACVSCPPGTTNTQGDDASSQDTLCDPTLCDQNQHVVNNVCVSCPPGTDNAPGDNASGNTTSCSTCEEGTYSTSGSSCTPWKTCLPGTYVSNAPNNQSDRTCETCPSGTTTTTENESECTEKDPLEENENQFNIVTYNIFARDYLISHDGQLERVSRIPETMSAIENTYDISIDAISFDEVFIYDDILTSKLANENPGWPYSTPLLNGIGLENGGVIIASRWPIIATDHHVYSFASCSGDDCLAAKGIVYAQVVPDSGPNKNRKFHLFATHMQAWPENHSYRLLQAQEFEKFIASKNIPTSEPLFLMGDFNEDLINNPNNLNVLLGLAYLNATMPPIIGSQLYTADPSRNVLVGRDGSADSCWESYESNWGDRDEDYCGPNCWFCWASDYYDYSGPGSTLFNDTNKICPCCEAEWLDYIVTSASHLPPATSSLEAVVNRYHESFEIPITGKADPSADPACRDVMQIKDLSDHYPVLGKFTFTYPN